MQYKIEWMEKKQISGKDIIEASLSGEGVTPSEKVTIWKTDTKGEEFPGFDGLMPGHMVDGNLWSKPGSNFKTLYPAKDKKAGGGGAFKAQQIEKVMDRKEKSIAQAQDRSAWMWAKTNASTLLASAETIKGRGNEDISLIVLDLATKIYNGEPTEPF